MRDMLECNEAKRKVMRCSVCQTEVAGRLFCKKCGRMQRLPSHDYYWLFGLQPTLHIDQAQLDMAYFRLQQALHPDKMLARPGDEQMVALNNSALVNTAYKTLSDKLARATYLIGKHAEEAAQVPQEFMLQTLEWHERKLEVNSQDELALLKQDIMQTHKLLWEELHKAVEGSQWQQANVLLSKINTITRLL